MNINGFKFTVGADPEVWMYDELTGQIVSAHGAIKGNKRRPTRVESGAVQVDGMALEFNIDPAENSEKFKKNIDTVLKQLEALIPNHKLKFVPVAHFGEDYISNQPRMASNLGCEPDFNAYTKEVNPRPNVKAPFRTASGHIHVGWTKLDDPSWPESYDVTNENHLKTCYSLVKALDFFVLLPMVIAFNTEDEILRRSLYGAPGAFRPKPYGVEYRSPSNAWLTSPEWMDYVFNGVHLAINHCFNCQGDINTFYGYDAYSLIKSVQEKTKRSVDIVENIISNGYLAKPPGYEKKSVDDSRKELYKDLMSGYTIYPNYSTMIIDN